MIAVSGLVARHLGRDGALTTTPVAFVSPEYTAFVYDEGELRTARSLRGFSGIYPAEQQPLLLPGGDWMIDYGVPGESHGRRRPVVAWRIDPASGRGDPLIADEDGDVRPLSETTLVVFGVWHPKQRTATDLTSSQLRLLRPGQEAS